MKQHIRSRRGRGGQTLIETALVLAAILLPVTLGILQFGIVLNANNTLTQIAREGGRFAALHGTTTSGTTATTDAAIRNYIRQVCAGTTISPADLPDSRIAISMVDNKPRSSGNAINVTITYPMSRKIFVGSFFSDIANLGGDRVAKSTFVLE